MPEPTPQSWKEKVVTPTPPPSPNWTAPSPSELAPLFPDLELIELLGRGGMGAVYKVRQRRLGRLAALKILPLEVAQDPAFAERFAREARVLAGLSHANLVTVFDFGEASGRYWFLMEYVDGLNLRQLLSAGKITPREALAVVPQICDALQFAHEQGVVHRDIKPENILIDKFGRVKITDFGLAKLMEPHVADVTLTGTGQSLGSPTYMAPEQIEHPEQVDHRADIYSLGVVFYQMLTGELPLGRFAPPSRKVQIDVRLDAIVLRALEKEPELRFQQASEVKTQVQTVTNTGTPPVIPPVASPPAAPPASAPAAPPPPATSAPTPAANAQPAKLCPTVIWAGVLAGLFLLTLPGCLLFHGDEQITAIFAALALGITTTICGAVAISQIRHSEGRLYGLGLAVFELLLFPLLLLNALPLLLLLLA